MKELVKERQEVARFMRRLYQQKLTTASGGNVSIRSGDYVIITASQSDKANLTSAHVGIMRLDGENLTTKLKPSMESGMHLAIYRQRSDIRAVVHAHPVFATAFAVTGKKVNTGLAGESRAMLGTPVNAGYALMGTQELADIVARVSVNSNVILMENHGVVTLGSTLFLAYDRMEVVESTAKLTLIAEILGDPKTLSAQDLINIDELFK